jgi:hypothetical protein
VEAPQRVLNSGKPKGSRGKLEAENRASLIALAKVYTEEMLNLLVGIARGGESESARIAAIVAILDRGNGKPKEAVDVEVSGKDGGPIESREVSDIEAARQIAFLLHQASAQSAERRPLRPWLGWWRWMQRNRRICRGVRAADDRGALR